MNNDLQTIEPPDESLLALRRYFGYEEFRGRQGDIIRHVMGGITQW